MKEFGGYLPLELGNTGEYYDLPADKILKINSGLTAIFCALKMINPGRVILPYFICPTVDDLLASMNIETAHYNINEEFEPINLSVRDNDCIILVNYFGINTKMIKKNYKKFGKVIIDNTEAFFSEPIFDDNVYNVYSCRKFIGVPDGGYLIGNNLSEFDLEQDFSSMRSGFLMMQYEYGINGAYKASKENYDQIKSNRKSMSELTKRILQSVNYSGVKKKRTENFKILNSFLEDKNELHLELAQGDIPYSYPFMVRKDIRSSLIENKIYVPWIWKEKKDSESLNATEQKFINFIYHLPIDQRYNDNDLQYISRTVIKLIEERK